MLQVENRLAAQVRNLQLITIAWMAVELSFALFFGLRACSIALTAFGADSGIELFSALVVLRRFSLGATAERRAAILCAMCLYLLGAYILVSVVFVFLRGSREAEPTVAGIILLILAAIIMPFLGRAKRRLAFQTGSRALGADAAQSRLCAYMSWIALAGLGLNLVFHIPWADSIAALLLLPIVLKEAGEARKGQVCECC